ncbi:HTH-type transcriptional activator Btr [compost metagenome]
MSRMIALREEMDMPDPYFPAKLNSLRYDTKGQVIFQHHWHTHLELQYFVSGEAVIECNGVPLCVKSGDLVVLNSNDLHMGVCQSDELAYHVLIVDIALLHSLSPDAIETKYIAPIARNQILFQNRIESDANLNRCMDAMIKEFREQEPGYELSIKSSLYRLLTLLVRSYVTECSQLPQHESRTRNLERFAPVFDYIAEHLDQELTASELADLIGLSRYHFSRLFSSLTGRTISEYINQLRINRSEQLLRHSTMTVSEIAWAIGFKDVSYFSRTFKKYKSLSPSELRTER